MRHLLKADRPIPVALAGGYAIQGLNNLDLNVVIHAILSITILHSSQDLIAFFHIFVYYSMSRKLWLLLTWCVFGKIQSA